MAVSPMHSTAAPPNKSFQDRAITGTIAKVANTTSTSQQAPSRPASTAANARSTEDRSKTPLAPSEDLMRIRETDQTSLSPDSMRSITTPNPNMNFVPDAVHGFNPAMRGPPGANAAPGFVQPHQFFSPGLNLGVPPQTGYGPSPQMQFFPGYNPNAYAPTGTSTRPNSAVPKYSAGVDPKFSHAGPGQFAHSNPGPQMGNNMSRRPSNYFVAPSMSPVQNAYGARPWVPGNATMITGPMGMQNGTASIHSAAMYQPAMMASPNPPLMTPPGAVPQHGFSPAFAPATVPNPTYAYPTPTETPAVQLPPDVPPAVPSIYPDPAYSNINACLYNPKGTTNVYIRGLRPETTDEDLLHMVRSYGNIISTKAIIDTQTKMCKGFGFAKFENVDQGMACIVALSAAGYQCSFAKESFSNRLKDLSEPSNTNLYISNLPAEVDEQRLDELLKPHRVHSSRILRDSMRNSRGVGFARMTDREAAEAVIEQWNGKTYPGSETPLQVRFADTPMQKKLKSVTARRRSWRAKEYNSLTQGRPLSPSTQRYYEEHFGQGNVDYPAAQLYANGGNWQQDNFNGAYLLEAEAHHLAGQL